MIVKALEYLVLMTGVGAFAVGYMVFGVVVLPDLADAVRLTFRITRAVVLAVGWAVLVARLLLA